MGAHHSRILRDNLTQSTVDELLSDDTFLELLGSQRSQLSCKSLRNAARLLNVRTTDAPLFPALEVPRLKQLLALEPSDLELPQCITSSPRGFPLRIESLFSLEQNAEHQVSRETTLADRYNQLFMLENRRIRDQTARRFYLLFFYDLHTLVNNQGQVTRKSQETLKGLVNLLSAPDMDRAIIGENLKRWIGCGRRYHQLSESLGSRGCLLLLPSSVNDHLWENSLPMKGPAHDQAAQLLTDLGILSKSRQTGACDAARDMSSELLAPFSWINYETTSLKPKPSAGHNNNREMVSDVDLNTTVSNSLTHPLGNDSFLSFSEANQTESFTQNPFVSHLSHRWTMPLDLFHNTGFHGFQETDPVTAPEITQRIGDPPQFLYE